MASVETTTIRVRRSTHKRLQEEAERQGKSVTEVLDVAADMLHEQRLLESAERSWEKHGDEMREEMAAWDATLADGLAAEDWSDLDVDADDRRTA
jgi:uncharacterized protein (DUF1778 family)